MNDDQNVRIYDEITLFQKRRTFMMLFIASTNQKGGIEPQRKEEKEERQGVGIKSATNGIKQYTHPYIMKSISQIAANDIKNPEEQVEQYHLHKDENHKVLIDSNKKNIQDKNNIAEKPSKEEDIFLEMAHNIINNDDNNDVKIKRNLDELVESWNTIMPDKYGEITVEGE